MGEILKFQGHAKPMTYEQLLVVIQKWEDGEWDLFLTIKDWLDVDYKNHKQHLDSLMSHVRFSLLTPTQLKAVKNMKMYSEGSWEINVQVGENLRSRPIHKKMMRPTSVRSKPQVVCFTDENRSTMHTLQEDGHWKAIDVPKMPRIDHGIDAMLVMNNCLIIAEEYQTWHVFDASTFTWSKMQRMKNFTYGFALVHDDRYLYALGGVDLELDEDNAVDTIERYDPGTNTWTVMKTKLPRPLCNHSVCVCSGPFFSIYVAGGYEKPFFQSDFLPDMNCFNPYEKPPTWHRKAPMLIPEECHVMREMVFDGTDPAIIIMCMDLVIQYYQLKTNQWSLWKGRAHIDIDWQWHNNGTVLPDPSKNTLYLLNIIEEFADEVKEPDQGVCGKWQLGKVNDPIIGTRVDRFPIKTECWEDYTEPDYFAAILAMPTPSKRTVPTHASQSGGKAKAKAKRSSRWK